MSKHSAWLAYMDDDVFRGPLGNLDDARENFEAGYEAGLKDAKKGQKR